MKKLLAAAALALLSAPLAAQPGISVGVGPGITQSDDLTGGAGHAQISAHLVQIMDGLTVRAEAMVQQGTVSGSPFSCQIARQQYCTGRSDQNRLMGAAVYTRLDLASNGRMTAYLTPVGLGLYHRRTHTTEAEAPTAICIEGGQMVSCPGNPPFTEFSETTSMLSLGWNTGGGVEMAVGRGRVFAEMRMHSLLEGEGMAGALPITFGYSF